MKRNSSLATGWRGLVFITMATVSMMGLATLVGAKDTAATPAKKLTGEQLFAMNCSRCHTERYPTEFSKVQWQTLLMHMRVRANLPPATAQAIYKYMLENK